MDNPIPLIMSKGWLYLFLLVIFISILRIIQKIMIIHRETSSKGRVHLLKPMSLGGKATSDSGENVQGEDDTASLVERRGSLVKELEHYPAGEFPADHARILSELGEIHTVLSRFGDRKEELLKAAHCFYMGSQVRTEHDAPHEYISFLVNLADTYMELAGFFERNECLSRAAAAYGRALTATAPAVDSGRSPAIGASLGRALLDLADMGETEVNLLRAVRVLNDSVKGFSDDRNSPEYALAMFDLGRTFLKYAAIDDPKKNLLRAGKAFKESMRVLTREKYPEQHERARASIEELKEAYGKLPPEGE